MGSVRTQLLHDLMDRALDNTLSKVGGPTEFARCFAVVGDKCEVLTARYEDAMVGFRANVKAEVRKTLEETGLSSDLRRLDALIAQQPHLKDGRRCLPPGRVLPSTAVSAAAGEQRVLHKRKLESFLGELEAENESIRGAIETSRVQVAATSTRVRSLYTSAGEAVAA
ncbi:hypothetical protein T492DRAFT_832582 [Pavlovales sp. CCMP2436]|nr:hypothetical protein T492DRAFT_832582 [Pavlovales sp. CCMP2436]|mmetsp:Transcript_15106/g.38334  ORF Transcript_15106/g.38334 Transcript_15106/m.38334 type:complete len:168 (+) Transcript_15106:48-551(+)|eukprot:CAMPEP_0179903580 /NCGR_PEP_ID=MMETSP0982-20121206/41363_1 /TAXON_ID=483367 /ORGANISM="non described non described, Strain CCMP 2436" /LENGTH=167 /DNA_ID=CAMNT_0021803183 /DNA_START=43 /DNA_END=546 /DNA_ORIENTATION=+